MSDEQMQWMKHAEGTGDSESLYVQTNMGYVMPQTAMRATLIDSDMDKIAAIVRKEVHAALLLDMEDQRAWEETFSKPHVQAGLNRLAEEARREYEARETVEGGFACEDEDRIEPRITTVQGKNAPIPGGVKPPCIDANGLYRQCTKCWQLQEIMISRRNPEVAAVLDALWPFLKRCECRE